MYKKDPINAGSREERSLGRDITVKKKPVLFPIENRDGLNGRSTEVDHRYERTKEWISLRAVYLITKVVNP